MIRHGLDENPLMSFNWKGHDQLYLIKDHFIHTVKMDSDNSAGNPGRN